MGNVIFFFILFCVLKMWDEIYLNLIMPLYGNQEQQDLVISSFVWLRLF